ncbi:MAG: class I lanthipeptide [Caldilineaceae bacterium]
MNTNKLTKRLKLHRETLRELTPTELHVINGASDSDLTVMDDIFAKKTRKKNCQSNDCPSANCGGGGSDPNPSAKGKICVTQ